MTNEPDLGEQALGKVVEVALASQLDEARRIEVDIRTAPAKLVQGQLDSLEITTEGMTTKQNIRIESIDISTEAVAIDPLKAIMGELEFTEPLHAQAKILLTESDLNRALTSEYFRSKAQGIQIEHEGQVIVFDLERAIVRLQDAGQIAVETYIFLPTSGEHKSLSAQAIPFISDSGYRINMEFLAAHGEGLSLDFLVVLFNRVVELLDLRNLDLGDNSIRLQTLEVYPGRLLLQITTTIQEIS